MSESIFLRTMSRRTMRCSLMMSSRKRSFVLYQLSLSSMERLVRFDCLMGVSGGVDCGVPSSSWSKESVATLGTKTPGNTPDTVATARFLIDDTLKFFWRLLNFLDLTEGLHLRSQRPLGVALEARNGTMRRQRLGTTKPCRFHKCVKLRARCPTSFKSASPGYTEAL
jgi:hypothetical protein